MPEPSSFSIVIAAAKIWAVFYGGCLLLGDMWFTYLPTTVIGITLIYFGLIYFKLPLPPSKYIEEVFGEDANLLIEKYRKNQTVQLTDFIPITSRFGAASTSSNNQLDHIISSMNIVQSPSKAQANNKVYTMWIIGHRGAGLDAPENSISAFRQCKSRGCLAVEFDVALTKDAVPIIFHDSKLTRIAGIDRFVREMTWDELKHVDISINHPLHEKYKGERIPTLDEAIETCIELDLRFFIDLKDPDNQMVQIIVDAYKKYGEGMYKRAIVSSFYPQLIYQVRRQDPNVIGSMAWRPGYNQYEVWNGNLEGLEHRHSFFMFDWIAFVHDLALKWTLPNVLWWFLGLSVVLLNKDGITKEDVTHWMKRGLRIFAWTVNSPIEKLHLTYDVQIGHLTDTLDGEPYVPMIDPIEDPSIICQPSKSNKSLDPLEQPSS